MTVTRDHAAALLGYARARIGEELRRQLGEPYEGPVVVQPGGAWAEAPAATFVTLRWPEGRLQGCIGSLEARRSLVDDVGENAVSAAFYDPRARPMSLRDLARLHIEISVLSPLEPIPPGDRASIYAAITPGVHGVVLHFRGRRATLLPAVWESIPDRNDFMDALFEKAGLTPGMWNDELRFSRYSAEVLSEHPSHSEHATS